MNSARFVEAAREEFLAEAAYYAEAQPGLGERFVAAVEEATASEPAPQLIADQLAREAAR